MDAYGNLTELSEFSNNRRIRLISYMDPDLAMGVHATLNEQPPNDPIPLVQPKYATRFGLRRVSGNEADATVFVAGLAETGDMFNLAWARDLNCVVEWGEDDGVLGLRDNYAPFMIMSDNGSTAHFTVDFVDGCWFALNIPDRSRVVDVYEERTDDLTSLILYPWHGGANQIWRAEAV